MPKRASRKEGVVKEAQAQAREMLETTMMGEFASRLPAQLSGGRQQIAE